MDLAISHDFSWYFMISVAEIDSKGLVCGVTIHFQAVWPLSRFMKQDSPANLRRRRLGTSQTWICLLDFRGWNQNLWVGLKIWKQTHVQWFVIVFPFEIDKLCFFLVDLKLLTHMIPYSSIPCQSVPKFYCPTSLQPWYWGFLNWQEGDVFKSPAA